MGKVLLEMSVSLDGYAAGPGVSPDSPLGRGGERRHEWRLAGKSTTESQSSRGTIQPRWGPDPGTPNGRFEHRALGEKPTFHAPCFVVTHRPAETIVKKGARPTSSSPTGFRPLSIRRRRPRSRRTCSSMAAPTSPANVSMPECSTRFVFIWCRWSWAPAHACSTAFGPADSHRRHQHAWGHPPKPMQSSPQLARSNEPEPARVCGPIPCETPHRRSSRPSPLLASRVGSRSSCGNSQRAGARPSQRLFR